MLQGTVTRPEERSTKVMTTTETRTGVVKWFDPIKRYGFVTMTDGDKVEDAMLHVSCLRAFKAENIVKDSKVTCEVEKGPNGWQVKTLVSLEQPTDEERLALFVPARVKWFNALRGYGFVTRGDDTPDVFVHAETIKSGSMIELRPNQAVLVLVEEGPKGPKALDVKAIS